MHMTIKPTIKYVIGIHVQGGGKAEERQSLKSMRLCQSKRGQRTARGINCSKGEIPKATIVRCHVIFTLLISERSTTIGDTVLLAY